MSRRPARAALLGSALLGVVLTASPAFAADQLGRTEGAEPGAGLSAVATIAWFILVPAVILLGVAALVWLPGMVKADRYRPARGWTASPVWFAGPPDPVAAVETAETSHGTRGGASGTW